MFKSELEKIWFLYADSAQELWSLLDVSTSHIEDEAW